MELLDEIYSTKLVYDGAGNAHDLRAHVSPPEGRFIAETIARHGGVAKSLEVGCAYGLSSLHICAAIKDAPGRKHVIIDPFQRVKWHGIGLSNLERAGVDFFEFIEDGSEFAMPRLAKEEAGTFDLVFIDGCHYFDHTLVDLFYANRLLRIGGLLIVDDTSTAPVAKAVRYFAKLPSYRVYGESARTPKARLAMRAIGLAPDLILGAIPHALFDRYVSKRLYASMIALEKVSEEVRDWRSMVPF